MEMTVCPRPVRTIEKRTTHVKSGKQPNRTLFSVAMSPTTVHIDVVLVVDDYQFKEWVNVSLHLTADSGENP